MTLHPGHRVYLHQLRDPQLVHMIGATGTVVCSECEHPDWPGIVCRKVVFDKHPARSGFPWGVRADDLLPLPEAA
jgi:hypothetical protein